MTELAVATRPFVAADPSGGRLSYVAGDIVEPWETWPASARTALLEMEKVEVLPSLEQIREVAKVHGYKLVPVKKGAA